MSIEPSDNPNFAGMDEQLRHMSATLAGYSLPQLPEDEMRTVYHEIRLGERLASPDLTQAGYGNGSASEENETMYLQGAQNKPLLTGEHSTDHARPIGGVITAKEADWGVAGLIAAVHAMDDVSGLIAIGRQTGDPNYDLEHPFKDTMARIIHSKLPSSILSIHGMRGGYFSGISDREPYDIAIGIGKNPTDATREHAEHIYDSAKALGLRTGINKELLVVRDGMPVQTETGLRTITFGAANPRTTRSFAQGKVEESGLKATTLQLELAPSLRALPVDIGSEQAMIVERAYLGYLVLKASIKFGQASN